MSTVNIYLNFAAPATTVKKVTEQFRTIRLLFKRLRLLFDKCNDTHALGKYKLNVSSNFRFRLTVSY